MSPCSIITENFCVSEQECGQPVQSVPAGAELPQPQTSLRLLDAGLQHDGHPGRRRPQLCTFFLSLFIIYELLHKADGIAIGAAFSISLAAGFSTSIAVLCHELPHEVGDFALLLHSGMTVKVAVFYNLLSSVFAFLGLLVGLVLGTQGNFSSWLLSGTVGVFLYVALVSMLSELKGGHWARSVSNTLGMIAGSVLLLFIGLYEHDLILLFQEDHDDH